MQYYEAHINAMSVGSCICVCVCVCEARLRAALERQPVCVCVCVCFQLSKHACHAPVHKVQICDCYLVQRG